MDLEIASADGIEAERALGLLILPLDAGVDRPAVVELDAEREATAIGVGLVEILLYEGLIVDDEVGCRIAVGQLIGPRGGLVPA